MTAPPLRPIIMAPPPPIGLSISIIAVTPRPVATTVLSLPPALVSIAFVFSPLPVLAVVLTADPTDQGATYRAKAGEDEVAYQTASGCTEECVRFGGA